MRLPWPRIWLVLCWAGLALQIGCGPETHVIADLGHGDYAVVVYRHSHAPDASVRVALRTAKSEFVLLDDRMDRWPNLVEVATEGRVAGVLICSMWADKIEAAFSLDDRKILPGPISPTTRSSIRSALTLRYKLVDADLIQFHMDPIEWACSPRSEALGRFEKLISTSRKLPPLLQR